MADMIDIPLVLVAMAVPVGATLLLEILRYVAKRQRRSRRPDFEVALAAATARPVATSMREPARQLVEQIDADEVELLSSKGDRLVLRVLNSNFGDAVLKVVDGKQPQVLHGLYAEAATLTYLTARDCVSVPHLKSVELGPGGSVALIRDDVSGSTLHDQVRTSVVEARWPTVSEVLDVCEELAWALESIHKLGVVHGDLKPANVLFKFLDGGVLAFESRAKIIDFESSQVARDANYRTSRSGTWGFIAPERYVGDGSHTQSDVFSLGAIGWFLFAGHVGSYGGSAGARVPAEIRKFLRSSLDIDYQKRPTDAIEWLTELRRARRSLTDRELGAEMDWPHSWRPHYDSLMTHTFERAIVRARAEREALAPQAKETYSREAMRALQLNQAMETTRDQFERYLRSDSSLVDFATREKLSEGRIRRNFTKLYDQISEEIRQASDPHTPSRPTVAARLNET